MNTDVCVVDVQFISGPGALKARFNIRIEFPRGALLLYGFSVIEKDGKPPWVGFPSKAGKTLGKYFPVVEAEGEIRQLIIEAILEAYRTRKAP
jgi:hypothetical protein